MDNKIYIIIAVVAALLVVGLIVFLVIKKKKNSSSEPIHADYDPSIAKTVEENNLNNIPTTVDNPNLESIEVDNVLRNTDENPYNNVEVEIREVKEEDTNENIDDVVIEAPQESNESFIIPDEEVKFEAVVQPVKKQATFITEDIDDKTPAVKEDDNEKKEQEVKIDVPDAVEMTEINKQL